MKPGLALVLMSWAAIGLAFVGMGGQLMMLISIPVMVTAWVYGLRGALVAAVVALPWTLFSVALGGLDPRLLLADSTVWVGQGLTGGLGVLLGYSSTLRTRLEVETRAKVQAEMEASLLRADRLATVGTLAAGVAHEVNNPLTYLLANLELMKADLELVHASASEHASDWANIQAELADATEGAQRIEKIMRELKLFVRERDELTPVDLGQVVETSWKLTRHELKPGTELVRKLDPVPAILGDAGKLAQVFVNLIVNAAQAIPEARGRGRIVIELVQRGREVVASVIDDGEGMTAEVRRKAFDPFFTTKPVGIGTGLGLPVCASILRHHGGTLEFDSERGRGTTFRLRMPIPDPTA